MGNFHRFDAVDSAYAIALMSDITPAWREVYGQILDRCVDRITQYWGTYDWSEQKGPDPEREKYPDEYSRCSFPTNCAANMTPLDGPTMVQPRGAMNQTRSKRLERFFIRASCR